jgi:peptide-methionine (S)-S-oxide reductase
MQPAHDTSNLQVATLAGGCFWCLEAVFDALAGVESVESGYMGGSVDNPTYEQVCRGATGHAEVVQIRFDPAVVSYRDILAIFFAIHDPTTLDRQGNDVGTQYRSAIFPTNAEQERKAREAIDRANVEQGGRVVTTIEPMGEWWPAETYHQDYWATEGQRNPYCLATIPPKLQKLRKSFQARAKSATAQA